MNIIFPQIYLLRLRLFACLGLFVACPARASNSTDTQHNFSLFQQIGGSFFLRKDSFQKDVTLSAAKPMSIKVAKQKTWTKVKRIEPLNLLTTMSLRISIDTVNTMKAAGKTLLISLEEKGIEGADYYAMRFSNKQDCKRFQGILSGKIAPKQDQTFTLASKTSHQDTKTNPPKQPAQQDSTPCLRPGDVIVIALLLLFLAGIGYLLYHLLDTHANAQKKKRR